jgi:hypothetical protein
MAQTGTEKKKKTFGIGARETLLEVAVNFAYEVSLSY